MEQARHAEAEREVAARAEADRLATAVMHVEKLALSEAITREHSRALEAARLLKATQEAEHTRSAHEASDMAELFRREEILLDARRETTTRASPLAEAYKLAKDNLAARRA